MDDRDVDVRDPKMHHWRIPCSSQKENQNPVLYIYLHTLPTRVRRAKSGAQ